MENARTFTIRLADLLARERTALGEFLVALSEFDRRRLWLQLGYGSLFDFLHRELGLSKASASFRKKAAELLQRFPDLAEPLRDGRLCLTSVFELAKVLTPENRDEVLPRFFQLSRREAKSVVAELRPNEAPPRREVVTAVPSLHVSPASGPSCASSPRSPEGGDALDFTQSGLTGQTSACQLEDEAPRGTASLSASVGRVAVGAGSVVAPAAPPRSVEPLTAELNRLHVTVSRRFLEKLEKARAALSHSHPGAGADEILEAGLDLLLERHAKRRGIVQRPRREPPPSAPGYIPAHVRREVWERDQGRCQWPLEGGGICGSTLRVEFDHRDPLGLGGLATVRTVRVLCRVHNDFAARLAYGDAWMDRYTRGGRAVPELRLPP